jgi:hypothetical protein
MSGSRNPWDFQRTLQGSNRGCLIELSVGKCRPDANDREDCREIPRPRMNSSRGLGPASSNLTTTSAATHSAINWCSRTEGGRCAIRSTCWNKPSLAMSPVASNPNLSRRPVHDGVDERSLSAAVSLIWLFGSQ